MRARRVEIRPAAADVSAVSSLTGPSREFTRDSSGADPAAFDPSREFTRDSSGADPRPLSRAASSRATPWARVSVFWAWQTFWAELAQRRR